MNEEYKIGGIVVLKSGGPSMTVTDIKHFQTGGRFIECVWFFESEKRHGSFIDGSLSQNTTGSGKIGFCKE